MKQLLLTLTLAASLSACVSTQKENPLDVAAKQLALESKLSPEQALVQAREILTQAQQAELNFYTPLGFAKIQKGLESMTRLDGQPASKGKDPKLELLKEYFKLEERLTQAKADKETITATLANALEHKAILEELGTPNDLPAKHQDMVEDLVDLFELIEKNEIKKAQDEQKDLLVEMTELEVDTLLLRHLKPAQIELDKAEDIDADDLAEETYEKAEQKIDEVAKFIRANYRERADVARQGVLALIAAQRAFNIAEQSKTMLNLNEKKAEQKALEIEALFAKVRDAMGQEEIRGLSLAEQVRILADKAAAKE